MWTDANTDPLPQLDEPVHDNGARKRRVRAKRVLDKAAKVRSSKRIAAREAALHLDMTSKAMQVKERSFDMSLASPSLAAAVRNARIIDEPDRPVASGAALRHVAIACGAEPADADTVAEADTVVPDADP